MEYRQASKFPRRTLMLLATAMAFCLLLGWLAQHLFFALYIDRERHLSAQRLEAFARSLEATLSRHESLPGLLALDPSLAALLREPDSSSRIIAANAYLEAAQNAAAVAATFLIDAQGKTLAASNWHQPQRSFVGKNYAFRPYFIDTLKKGHGRFYGVGVTTGEPGYFLATALHEQDQVLGVIVVKVDLGGMEQALASAGDPLLLADADGVVFLASEPKLRYRALVPLSQTVIDRLTETRQYGDQTITPLADRAIPSTQNSPLRVCEKIDFKIFSQNICPINISDPQKRPTSDYFGVGNGQPTPP